MSTDGKITAEIGGSFVMCPPGGWAANCFALIVAGTRMESFQGRAPEPKLKCFVGFEITGQKYNDQNGFEKPHVIWNEYLLNLGPKANLRKMIESWTGQKFTDAEMKDFDLRDIVGNQCLANVINKKTSNGKDRHEIMGVSKLPEGLPCLEPINQKLIFQYTNPFDTETFNRIEPWIQKIMQETPEYKAAVGAGITTTPAATTTAQPAATEVPKKKLF